MKEKFILLFLGNIIYHLFKISKCNLEFYKRSKNTKLHTKNILFFLLNEVSQKVNSVKIVYYSNSIVRHEQNFFEVKRPKTNLVLLKQIDYLGELLITKDVIKKASIEALNKGREYNKYLKISDVTKSPNIKLDEVNFMFGRGYIRYNLSDVIDVPIILKFWLGKSDYEEIEVTVPMKVSEYTKYLYSDLDNYDEIEDEFIEESKKPECKFIITYKNEKGKEKVKNIKAKSKSEANRKFKEECGEEVCKIVSTEKEESKEVVKEDYNKETSDILKEIMFLKDRQTNPEKKRLLQIAIDAFKEMLKMKEVVKESKKISNLKFRKG
jgi:hypothetical protein